MTKNDQILSVIIDVHAEKPKKGVFIAAPAHAAAALLQRVPFHPDDFRIAREGSGFRIWRA